MEIGITKDWPMTCGADGDRRCRYCKCRTCGIVALCQPEFDFYTLPNAPEGLLECETCMRQRHGVTRMVDLTGAPSPQA